MKTNQPIGRNIPAFLVLLWLYVAAAISANSQTADSFSLNAGGGDFPSINAIAIQADGSVFVGGAFTGFRGSPCYGLGRNNPDGTLDTLFSLDTSNSPYNRVYCLYTMPNGQILVGGGFTNFGGYSRTGLVRLKPEGSLDLTFNTGTNVDVQAIAIQQDGKILIGGPSTNVTGLPRVCLARLHANGTVDDSFNSGTDGSVNSLVTQSDGKIFVGGDFTTLAGVPRNRIARLHANGTLDLDFDPGADGAVHSLVIQADGKILVAGSFTELANQPRSRLGRLHADGSPDLDFDPEANGEVRTLALQTDGKILVGGTFDTVGGQARTNLARLNSDGTVDGFDASANNTVSSLALQTDGKILVGGSFTTLSGASRFSGGRLNNDSPASESLTLVGSTMTWLRGGSSPEASRVAFFYSTDGSNWSELPAPERTSGGWQIAGVSIPPNSTLRARAYISGGFNNGSSWFIDSAVGPPAISVQPIDQIITGGGTARFSVAAVGTGPFTYQWFKNGVAVFNPNRSWHLANSSDADSRYDVLITSPLGSVRSTPARLWVMARDNSFLDGYSVYAMALQPDGGLIIGGNYTYIGNVSRSRLGRVTQGGSVDSGFNPGANGNVLSLAIQSDGKILAGGSFTSLAGVSRSRIGRLNQDGTLDNAFNPGANSDVYAIALQRNGQILVGGSFTNLAGQRHNKLGRLNADGSPDAEFNPSTGFPNDTVYCLAVQPDGKILVGGSFSTLNGQSRQRIGRLMEDGSLDPDFNAVATVGNAVYCIAQQADGKIILGGDFFSLNGQTRNRLGRLHPNGSLDTTFNPGTIDNRINSLAVQSDGKILVGGNFTILGGLSRRLVGRFTADGIVDEYDPTRTGFWGSAIYGLALQSNGKVLAGGDSQFVRLHNTSDASRVLTRNGTSIFWLRSGSSPEAGRVTFDYWNGASWIELGEAERIIGGWEMSSVVILTNTTIRARAYLTSGHNNGSSSIEESALGPPVVSVQPSNQAVFTSTAILTASVVGSGPFSYQWFRNGVAVSNGTNSSLNVALSAVVDSYEIVVSSPSDTVRSQPTQVWRPGADVFSSSGADSSVYALAVQTDEKILIGGAFTNSPGNYLARLNPNGTRDTNFTAGASGGIVRSLALQPDGKILVGGTFTNLAGQPRFGIGRLKADGTSDPTFIPQLYESVTCVALQRDGKILVGFHPGFSDSPAYSVVRLHPNGSRDMSFNPISPRILDSSQPGVMTLLVLPDDTIAVGGGFSTPQFTYSHSIVTLNLDGSINCLYYPVLRTFFSSYNPVLALAAQSDGGRLAVGAFQNIGMSNRQYIARFDAGNVLDSSFDAFANAPVNAVAVQTDGKILLAGVFTTVNGQPRTNLARLHSDGSLDMSFDLQVTSTNSGAYALGIHSDGKILVGGGFSSLAGANRKNIGRLSNTAIATQELTTDGANITWLRKGVSPEVVSTTFETSLAGMDWISAGEGTRIDDGWQWMGSVPENSLIRARGFISGNSSSWYVEKLLSTAPHNQPVLLVNDGNLGIESNRFGFNFTGSFGHVVIVEASTNLITWTPLQTNVSYDAPISFSDSSTNRLQRFYRVRSP